MTDRFKKMVGPDAKFVALFVQLAKQNYSLNITYSKIFQMQITKIKSALTGDVDICPDCLFKSETKAHIKQHIRNNCPSKVKTGRSQQKIYGFTLDDKTFHCHLGCSYFTSMKRDMSRHLIDFHSDE